MLIALQPTSDASTDLETHARGIGKYGSRALHKVHFQPLGRLEVGQTRHRALNIPCRRWQQTVTAAAADAKAVVLILPSAAVYVAVRSAGTTMTVALSEAVAMTVPHPVGW